MRMLVLVVSSLLLAGCVTPAGYEVRGGKLCRLGTDGRCYLVGAPQWSAYKLNKNFVPHRVR